MKSKKLLLTLSIILFTSAGIIFACADGWYMRDDSNFAPEAFVSDSYAPLFLSEEFFYGIMYDYDHATRLNDFILEDWMKYFGPGTDSAALHILLFGTTPDQIEALQTVGSGALPDSLAWAKPLQGANEKYSKALDYLGDAKIIETYSVSSIDYWDYDQIAEKSYVPAEFVDEIKSKYNTEANPFFKNRYWYLANKAMFYGENQESQPEFFEQNVSKIPHNYLYYSALGYEAGACYASGNFVKSNYLYSRIFDEFLPMRVTATYCYHPLESEQDWERCISQAKNPDEKCSLWALRGYYEDESDAIEEIYQLNPRSPHLDFLLSRIINKAENDIYGEFNSFDDEIDNQEASETEDNEVDTTSFGMDAGDYALIKQIADAGNTAKPWFWQIALGYADFLQSDFASAEQCFLKAEKTMPATPLLRDQLRLLRVINRVGSASQSSQLDNEGAVAELKWLFSEPTENSPTELRTVQAHNWVVETLSNLFKNEGNDLYSEMVNPDNTFYEKEANRTAMKNLLGKVSQSPLEKFLKVIYPISQDDISNYEASLLVFDDQVAEAQKILTSNPLADSTLLIADPFYGGIQDCHDCEFDASTGQISKREFIKQLITIEKDINKGVDLYTNCLKAGNAFYNISHFGNSRLFYQDKIIESFSTPFGYDEYYRKLLTDNSMAMKYYRKALDAATNNGDKAQAWYMLSKCERNAYYNTAYYFALPDAWAMFDTEIKFKAWEGFMQIKENYSHTDFYKQLIDECGYFRTYIQKQG